MSETDGKKASMSEDERVNETENEVLETEELAEQAEAPVDETAEMTEAQEEEPIDIEEPPPVQEPEDIEAPAAPADDKVADLEVEIDLLNQKLRVKTDQLVRLAADFDNYKKRARRDCEIEQASFAERLFTKLLPTLDAMDRAKQSVEDGDDLGHLRDGLSQIHSLFWAALKEVDVHPMDCVGKIFDPRFHEALMHHPLPGAEPNTVTVELQKGWVLGERVLRAARVGIAPDAPAPPPPAEEPHEADECEPEEVEIGEGQPEEPLHDSAKEVVEDDKVELPEVEENTEPYEAEEAEEAQDAGETSSTSEEGGDEAEEPEEVSEEVSDDKEESED